MTRTELPDSEQLRLAPGARVPVSVIIPTRNEERNLRQTLASVVNWADQIFVFDSFSDDRTLEIARELGVDVAQRDFDNFAAHKNWALDNLPIRNQWILFLDADERLNPELRNEVSKVICKQAGPNGYYVARKNIFMGQWIRHAGMYPDWQLRLLRHGKGRYEERIVHEHVVIDGPDISRTRSNTTTSRGSSDGSIGTIATPAWKRWRSVTFLKEIARGESHRR